MGVAIKDKMSSFSPCLQVKVGGFLFYCSLHPMHAWPLYTFTDKLKTPVAAFCGFLKPYLARVFAGVSFVCYLLSAIFKLYQTVDVEGKRRPLWFFMYSYFLENVLYHIVHLLYWPLFSLRYIRYETLFWASLLKNVMLTTINSLIATSNVLFIGQQL